MQLTIDDVITAEQARNAAIDMVEAGANPVFMVMAEEAVRETASVLPEFTTDDIIERAQITNSEPRAWGAVMRRAGELGICTATDRTKKSKSRVCHARPKRVWVSNICGVSQ